MEGGRVQKMMQNVLPLSPGHPLKNITGLARQISLPGEHAPLRFPSFPALERTATMAFNAPTTINVSSTLSDSGSELTLFRSPTYPVWADFYTDYYAIVEGTTSRALTSTGGVTIQNLTADPAYNNVMIYPNYRTSPTGQYPGYTAVNGSFPSKRWPVLGRDSGLEYIFVPRYCTVFLTVCTQVVTTAATNLGITLEQWVGPGEVNTIETLGVILSGNRATTAAVVAKSDFGRWIRLREIAAQMPDTAPQLYYSLCVTTGAALNGGPLTTGAGLITTTFDPLPTPRPNLHLPVAEPVEFANSILPWQATRVTSAAVLCTNVTQVLNKNGTVLCGRLSPNINDAWTCTPSTLMNLHPAEKAFLPMETGMYTYAPPSTDLVFFTDCTLNVSQGAPQTPIFSLPNTALYNKAFFKCSVDEVLALTCSWHIEFRTTSSLFTVGLSAMSLESLHAAQLALTELGYFFENNNHKGILGKVVGLAKKYAPNVLANVHPALGLAAKAGIALASKQKQIFPPSGPLRMPTTSATRSGFNGKSKTGTPQPKKKKGGKKK
jgi:hypothetical protein